MYKWVKRASLTLLTLALIYGVGRITHVYSGSFYSGERSPYIMMPSPTAMTLRWQSMEAYRGVIHYGLTPDELLNEFSEARIGEEHEIRITGLQPATRYYYSIGSEAKHAYVGDDYWFVTSPNTGASSAVRFAVLGDPGYSNPIQIEVRNSLLQYLEENARQGSAYLDILLTTGDNAYTSGSNKQFQKGFFNPYAAMLKNIPVWPAYGNHDARRWAFYNIFTFPQHAESGGLASGTESYYSFDYANIHFVILDSQNSDMSAGSEMYDWLQQDLAMTQQDWRIVVFHHPPYTHGSHDSDHRNDSSGRMFRARENILPILEQAGVDLVLSGHSHMYERSYLMTCHYDESDSLHEYMLLDKNKTTYNKSIAIKANQGTIYAVVGSSSKFDQGPLDHPAMAVSLQEAGALVVDVSNMQLQGTFISKDGIELDQFSITKSEDTKPVQNTCQAK